MKDGVEPYVPQPNSLHKEMVVETETEASDSTPCLTTTTAVPETSAELPTLTAQQSSPSKIAEDELHEILTPGVTRHALTKVAVEK